MTAQQQLAGLLKYGATLPSFQLDCAAFVSNHGPAVAELIEQSARNLAERMRRAQPAASLWNYGQAKSSREIFDDSEMRIAAALRKLTQDATP